MDPIIKLDNVTYTYEDEEEPVLKNVSLEIYKGEFVLIIGPSGSGKSTLCQTFNGIIPNIMEGEISGQVLVDGKNVLELNVKDLAESMGMVFQDPDAQLCNIYVEDEVAFAPENLKIDPAEIMRRIEDSLEKVRLKGFNYRKVHELSGGQKQKVGIASVLSMKPNILVLDNATANLDPQATREIFELLNILNKDFGHTIIIVESKIDEVMHLADRVIVIEDGQVVSSGSPRDLLETSIDKLIDMGVWVPEISELAVKLSEQGFKFNKFPITVHEAKQELKRSWNRPFLISSNKVEEMSKSRNVYSVQNLSYTYPSGTQALNNVSFNIKQGDFVAILGTNGSGKTTLVKHLMGIMKPPKGTVFFKDEDIHEKRLLDMTEHVGYVFQNPEHQFVTDNVLEETIYSLLVDYGIEKGEKIPEEIIGKGKEALESINLWDSRDKHPFNLSGGEKRRLSVVASLITGQDVVILDEPTTGQDYASATKLLELCDNLNKQGKTVIMITHDIRLVCKWAKKALVMNNGNLIYDGEISQLFLHEDILRKASLVEPPISQLAKQLSPFPLKRAVITVDEFFSEEERVQVQ
ncbi:cobalt ABC transporter ATP-binding protein [Compostibacillus humi]|uniref:Cobalt ABC transporter ATP-binding protein n=1 Tax=Compostibacillus humi TaxID=1245525 RepID=A0A8J2TNQ3_9BACI|nr:energy-coupling factor transporter ATPase [Compostibacillus humi]GFZ82114.1 cobalt ABC transporter ATP-binding protein [Compostibacillus humi]